MEEEINSLRSEILELKELFLRKFKQLKCSHKWVEIDKDHYCRYRNCEKCKIAEFQDYIGRGDYTDWTECSE